MKKVNTYILVCCALLASSCRKDSSFEIADINGGPDTVWYAPQMIQPDMPIVSLTNDLNIARNISPFDYQGSILNKELKPGLYLTVESGNLIQASGQPVTGMIDIEWACPETKPEIIRRSVSCQEGTVEEILGLFFVQFIQNGVRLNTSPNFKMILKYYPVSPVNANDYDYFSGTESATGDVLWERIPNIPPSTGYNYLSVPSNRQGWTMVAREELNINYRCNLRVKLPTLNTNANTKIFLTDSSGHHVVYGMKADIFNRTFYLDNIEKNHTYRLLAISKMEDTYYMADKIFSIPASQSADTTLHITPVVKSLPEILDRINQL